MLDFINDNDHRPLMFTTSCLITLLINKPILIFGATHEIINKCVSKAHLSRTQAREGQIGCNGITPKLTVKLIEEEER